MNTIVLPEHLCLVIKHLEIDDIINLSRISRQQRKQILYEARRPYFKKIIEINNKLNKTRYIDLCSRIKYARSKFNLMIYNFQVCTDVKTYDIYNDLFITIINTFDNAQFFSFNKDIESWALNLKKNFTGIVYPRNSDKFYIYNLNASIKYLLKCFKYLKEIMIIHDLKMWDTTYHLRDMKRALTYRN